MTDTAISAPVDRIRLHEHFIPETVRTSLLAYVMSGEAPWETYMGEGDIWYARLMNPQVMAPEIAGLMGMIRTRIARRIALDYGLEEPLYADTLQLVRWRVGDNQAPHADSENPGGAPHPFPWRKYASILYLNDAFEGGRIYFPDYDLEPPIAPGTLAFFPGTLKYLHGVTPVTSGIRYTMACFFTHDADKHDGASEPYVP